MSARVPVVSGTGPSAGGASGTAHVVRTGPRRAAAVAARGETGAVPATGRAGRFSGTAGMRPGKPVRRRTTSGISRGEAAA